MEKSKALKITGILMIIGASFTLALGVFALLIATAFSAALAPVAQLESLTHLWLFGTLLGIVGAVIQLIAGIDGVRFFDQPEKASICVIFGALTILLSLCGQVFGFIGGNVFDFSAVVMILLGLIVPVIYLVSALNLSKSVK